MRLALFGLALILATAETASSADLEWRKTVGDSKCREWGDRSRETYCEVREATFSAPAGAPIRVDASPNGGIEVRGGGQSRQIQILARVTASADEREDARALAEAVRIETGETIRSVGPSARNKRDHFSVSFELIVPDGLELKLDTMNGGIRLEDVMGNVDLTTLNGGVSIEGVSGQVRGRTTNGGISAHLTGSSWSGESLDLETTNGGVSLSLPEDFNARLETGTVNGGLRIDFPVTLQGRIDRKRLAIDLGRGGPLVRAVTTNGGVTIRHR
jgi:putative adhesin